MNGVLFLIFLGLFMGLAGLAAFLWSLRAGQYDDLKGAAERILIDAEDFSDAELATRANHSNTQQGERVRPRTRHHDGSEPPY